jgi:hypothetical protein
MFLRSDTKAKNLFINNNTGTVFRDDKLATLQSKYDSKYA